MRILFNGAKDTILEQILPVYPHFAKYIGWLNTPRASYAFKGLKKTGLPIACDNNAFTGFSKPRYLSMLKRAEAADVSLQWVTVPDVVENVQIFGFKAADFLGDAAGYQKEQNEEA